MNPPKRNYYGALGYFVGGHQLERFHLHQLQAPACSALNASDQLGGTLHTPRSPSRQRMRTRLASESSASSGAEGETISKAGRHYGLPVLSNC